ncbi:hypothetical protein Tco_1378941 [Tanacetum coccineum]|uniref:Uncharacterized protein n=1 Tax=Tanacetum coccineum TaxID=301880 RepID=A0ABQ4WNF7_9ASTR
MDRLKPGKEDDIKKLLRIVQLHPIHCCSGCTYSKDVQSKCCVNFMEKISTGNFHFGMINLLNSCYERSEFKEMSRSKKIGFDYNEEPQSQYFSWLVQFCDADLEVNFVRLDEMSKQNELHLSSKRCSKFQRKAELGFTWDLCGQ